LLDKLLKKGIPVEFHQEEEAHKSEAAVVSARITSQTFRLQRKTTAFLPSL